MPHRSARYRFLFVAALAARFVPALLILILVLATMIRVPPVAAFQRVQELSPKPEMMENCPGLVAAGSARTLPVAQRLALASDQVRFTYVGHSTFLIESPQLVRIATDYNDYVRPPLLPDIITMNHAHTSHYTDRPDPRIKHVLRGWGPSRISPLATT